MPRLPHKRKLSQSSSRALPLPTAQENDAMIGQTLWKDSTGKGLEPLARQGEQKLKAIKLAESQEDGADNAPASSLAASDANKTSTPRPHLRTIEEQNAITGKTFWPESTGKGTLPLANKVEMRERVAAQSATPKPDPQPSMNQTRQDKLKARANRATERGNQQRAVREAQAQDRQQRMDALSPTDQRRAARHGLERTERNIAARENRRDAEIGRQFYPESTGKEAVWKARKQARHGDRSQQNGGETAAEKLVDQAFDELRGKTGDLLVDLGNQASESASALVEQGKKDKATTQKATYANANAHAIKGFVQDMADDVNRTQIGLPSHSEKNAAKIVDDTKEILKAGQKGGHVVTRAMAGKLQGSAKTFDQTANKYAQSRFGKSLDQLGEADRVLAQADAVSDLLGDTLRHINLDEAIRTMGRRAAIVGYAFAAAEVIRAENKPREAAKQAASGAAGALAATGLMTLGGALSATGIGLPLGIAIMVGGAYLGSTAAETVFEWMVPKDAMKDLL